MSVDSDRDHDHDHDREHMTLNDQLDPEDLEEADDEPPFEIGTAGEDVVFVYESERHVLPPDAMSVEAAYKVISQFQQAVDNAAQNKRESASEVSD